MFIFDSLRRLVRLLRKIATSRLAVDTVAGLQTNVERNETMSIGLPACTQSDSAHGPNHVSVTSTVSETAGLQRLVKFRDAVLRFINNPWMLLVCKLTIGVVSAYDIFLTVKYFESLPMMELNPIGRWLMQLDSGPTCQLDQIAGFIAAKFVGNFVVLALIELMCQWKYGFASLAAGSVALAQLGLLYFLVTP